MTRPKLRPCPTCQTLNKASIRTCTVCTGPCQEEEIDRKGSDAGWPMGQGVVRNRNVNRIIDSAHIAVLKLEALGFKPILFYGHRDKKSQNKWVADVMTHFAPSSLTKHILDKMRRAYEILSTKADLRRRAARADHRRRAARADLRRRAARADLRRRAARADHRRRAARADLRRRAATARVHCSESCDLPHLALFFSSNQYKHATTTDIFTSSKGGATKKEKKNS
ncbi:hypothetical protein F7725_023366, partial [Dissostichus mawsoni]